MLHIGYHQLEGKREILKKPLAVLAKSNSEGEDTVYQVRLHRPRLFKREKNHMQWSLKGCSRI